MPKYVLWQVVFDNQYAYTHFNIVDNKFELYPRTSIKQTRGSWRDMAIREFVLNGKKIRMVIETGIAVECDELDEKFLTIAKEIPASEYGFWRTVSKKLWDGEKREDVLEFVSLKAVVRGLKA